MKYNYYKKNNKQKYTKVIKISQAGKIKQQAAWHIQTEKNQHAKNK